MLKEALGRALRHAKIESEIGQAHALCVRGHHRKEIETTGKLRLDDPHMVVQCSINERPHIGGRFPVNVVEARPGRSRRLRGRRMPSARQAGTTVRAKIAASVGTHGRTIISFTLLLLTWEALVRLLGIKLYILPPPSYVLSTLWTKWATIGARLPGKPRSQC